MLPARDCALRLVDEVSRLSKAPPEEGLCDEPGTSLEEAREGQRVTLAKTGSEGLQRVTSIDGVQEDVQPGAG